VVRASRRCDGGLLSIPPSQRQMHVRDARATMRDGHSQLVQLDHHKTTKPLIWLHERFGIPATSCKFYRGEIMNKNIELKARCPNLDDIREKAKTFGATFSEILQQTDTFFFTRSGKLKLRELNGSRAELIAYHRADHVEVRASEYTIIPIADAVVLQQALGKTLGIKQTIIKTRELWLWRNVRIHLDQVKGLGSFLEFEAVVSPEVNEETSSKNIAELRAALGIQNHQLIGLSYADLLGVKIADI